MSDSKGSGANPGPSGPQLERGGPPRRSRRPGVEPLEGRHLLAASLAPIGNISVPTTLGYQLPVQGGATPQTYTVTSDNPMVKASVAQGKFLTIGVSHASSGPNDPAISGNLVFQLFDDLTPLTTSKIEQFVNLGYYTAPTSANDPSTGQPFPHKNFSRIASGFPGANDFIVQGGGVTGTNAGNSNLPGTPFPDEFVQQLAFTGSGQLAMANAGNDTNDTQFFITTGSPRSLDFKHTIFGQLVSGQDILQQMTQVAKQSDGSTPVNPILMETTTLSDTNPNGVIHIDATAAPPGTTAHLTVTATDPSTGTTASQTFTVNVTPNTDASGNPINERPFLGPVSDQVVGKIDPATGTNQIDVFQLRAVDPTPGDQLTYQVGSGTMPDPNPQHGNQQIFNTTIPNATATVDQTTGVVRVAPNPGFTGVIPLLVGVRDQTNRAALVRPGQTLDSIDNFNTQMINLTVIDGTPVNLQPIALPGATTVTANTPTTVQLHGDTANPQSNQTLTYSIVTPPAHGTISNFNPATGTFTYTPATDYVGPDSVTFSVRDAGDPTPNLTSDATQETLNVVGAMTGAVRQIGRVLVVTPPPGPRRQTNTIAITLSNGNIQVKVNNQIDAIQPPESELDRIVVYGAKASDTITVAPDVTLPATLDGGHGGTNVLKAGGGPTREHGWFGKNTLQGGPEDDALIGRAGHVRFIKSGGKDLLFAGMPRKPTIAHQQGQPPSGTFYKFVGKRLVPLPTPV
ncbi:MAG: peptidylprolyl isomerase, partial [Isosphaeraceae bacterium]|nr:peptidylprolyl isomerase [Isosphaeraceae bacterium]